MAAIVSLPSFAVSAAAIAMSGVSLARIQVLEEKVQSGVNGKSITGPAGPPGALGPQGLQGVQGDPGPVGGSGDKAYVNFVCAADTSFTAPIPAAVLFNSLFIGTSSPLTVLDSSGPYSWQPLRYGVELTITGVPGSTDTLFLNITASVNITVNCTNAVIAPSGTNAMMLIKITQQVNGVDTLDIAQKVLPILSRNVEDNLDLSLSGSVQFPKVDDATVSFVLRLGSHPISTSPVLTGSYRTSSIQMSIIEF